MQLASSLRNIGEPVAAIELLRTAPDHPTVGAAREAFLALALFDAGQAGEALQVALQALTPTLPGYRRALDYYASELPTTGEAYPNARDQRTSPEVFSTTGATPA